MVDELLRLIKAFIKKSDETSFLNAVKISYKYIIDKDSLYKLGKDLFNYPNFYGDKKKIFINPLVSILVVSYNSGDDLIELFDSINKQTYKNLELILVENGSQKSDVYLNSLEIPNKFVSSNNIGFASANNLALEHSKGSFVCLVNPDTVLEKNVIEKLLLNIKFSQNVAVSVPKIVFYRKFFDIEISSNVKFNIDTNSLINSLNYEKYFIRKGEKVYYKNHYAIFSENNSIILSLPIDQSTISLKIRKAVVNQTFVFKINNIASELNSICTSSDEDDLFSLNINTLDKSLISMGKYIINNAGSGLRNKNPYDRGFGDYDLGHFDKPEFVEALCGCIAMISPEVFSRRKIFIDEFFAYFEDSELSAWILRNNLKIRYTPLALVRHKHSSSTEEGSLLWNTFVGRSKKIYDFLVKKKNKIIDTTFYEKRDEYFNIPNQLSYILKKYDEDLAGKSLQKLYKKNRPSAAIYNSFWNTMGGGEKHALSVAKLISKTHDIFLLSEFDFDEQKLKEYFSIDFKFRKIINTIDTNYTSSFDLFVNSTFCSSLIPNAKKNIYLVSFPHKIYNKNFLKKYYFFHNSNYTQKWAKRFWGKHKNSILYPILELKNKSENLKIKNYEFNNTNKNFISVGRFSISGHAKRQDFILNAFSEAQNLLNSDFNLFLVGSLDYSNQEDLRFFDDLKSKKVKNVHIFENLEFEKLQELLSISRFYVQATGVNINAEEKPHKLEHFGISLIEGMLYGNYPIVYSIGGPAETVKLLNIGETFNNFESLINIFTRIIKDYDSEKYLVREDFLSTLEKSNNQSIKFLKDLIVNKINI